MSAPGRHRRHLLRKTAVVYAPCEPGATSPTNCNVRYVGQTSDIENVIEPSAAARMRLAQHRSSSSGLVRDWIAHLGGDPAVFVLADLAGLDGSRVTEVEHDFIDAFRKAGADLLNTARRPTTG